MLNECDALLPAHPGRMKPKKGEIFGFCNCRPLRASGGGGGEGGWAGAESVSCGGVRARRTCRHVGRGGWRRGLNSPSKPMGRECRPLSSASSRRRRRFEDASPFPSNLWKLPLPRLQALKQVYSPVSLPVARQNACKI